MSESLVGEIQIFGFSFPPYGWFPCDGRLLAISQYSALFSLLGTNYGGNGTSTFALPDLRGRVAIGQGQGPGLTDRVIGEVGGSESTALNITQIPAHTHAVVGAGGPLKASSQIGTQPNPSATVNTLAAFDDPTLGATNFGYNNSAPDVALNVGATAVSGTVGFMGSNIAFSTMQPTLGLNYCINIYGQFPMRN